MLVGFHLFLLARALPLAARRHIDYARKSPHAHEYALGETLLSTKSRAVARVRFIFYAQRPMK